MAKKQILADIGIFGGSGFYDFFPPKADQPLAEKYNNVREIAVKTPFGAPSDKIALGEYAGKKIAFLARHGKNHKYPPHKIPYLANLWAFKKLGVRKIISPCACGSLSPKVKPGDFVLCDQFIDRTKNRADTFFNGPEVAHISPANPFCENLRKIAAKSCAKLKIPFHKKGTVVVIEGPRFSTAAESKWFQNQKWEVINMTQYPECILARELEMCYVNVSLITDYDAGLIAGKKIKPVDLKEVMRVFNENNEKVKKLIFEMIENISLESKCSCESALKNAVF